MRIELTTPDGRKFEVDPTLIKMLEDAQPGMMASGVKAVVYVGDGLHMQGVKETVAQIKQMESVAK
jgi:hypothetical protein